MLPMIAVSNRIPHLLPACIRKRVIDPVPAVSTPSQGFAVTNDINSSRH
jgi:hypothetical protein